jgi:preprotein translocase subunit SecE
MANEQTKTKQVKKPQQKKPNFFQRIIKYLRDVKGEYRKIVWPTWKQVWNNALAVLACVLVVAIVVWGLDAVFYWVRSLIFSR